MSVLKSDTSRLARGEVSETHQSLKNRRNYRITGIPIATQPNLNAVAAATGIDEFDSGSVQELRETFDEPHPKGIEKDASPYPSGLYPFNHVFESESGHIREIDDSPGAERLFTEHKSGTFEEIHPDGTKVVKVIGDNYEIIAGTSNIFIGATKNSGDALNLTVNGNVRELIKGDYHLEVEGDYTQKIHGSLRTKVGVSGFGNLEEEVIGNHAYHITGNVKGTVGPVSGQASPGEGDVQLNIVGNESHFVGKDLVIKALVIYLSLHFNDMTIVAEEDLGIATASGITSIKAGTVMDLRAATSAVVEADTGDLSLRSLKSNVDIDAGVDIHCCRLMQMHHSLI